MTWRVPVSDLLVDDELLEAVHEAVSSGWWGMGPRVEEFEQEFAAFLGTRHAVAVSSGTAALHVALIALGCGPADEVVMPSLNFVGAANVVTRIGATPVFCDIRGELDLNLDPTDVERAVGPRCKAIIGLHYAGFACDMGALASIAARHNLALVEDAAHSVGATLNGRMCGAIGDVGCFSFFSNKNLPIGEGGMVATDDDVLAARTRTLRTHGMTTTAWQRHHGQAHDYDIVEAGLNYRFDDVRAAVGLVQLRRLARRNEERRRLVTRYHERLGGKSGLVFPFSSSSAVAHSAHHLAVVLLPPKTDRNAIRAMLAAERIQTSVHYTPVHTFSYYASKYQRPLPRTQDVAGRLLSLPLYPHLSGADVDQVAEMLLRSL